MLPSFSYFFAKRKTAPKDRLIPDFAVKAILTKKQLLHKCAGA
jgi:hypothetical protein